MRARPLVPSEKPSRDPIAARWLRILLSSSRPYAVATRPGDPDVGAVGGGQVELMQLLAAVDQGIGRDRALEREGAVHESTLA